MTYHFRLCLHKHQREIAQAQSLELIERKLDLDLDLLYIIIRLTWTGIHHRHGGSRSGTGQTHSSPYFVDPEI